MTNTIAPKTPTSDERVSPTAILAEWCHNAEYVLISRRPEPEWYDRPVERVWQSGYVPVGSNLTFADIGYAFLYTPLQAAIVLDGVDLEEHGYEVVPVTPDGVTSDVYVCRHERVEEQLGMHAHLELTGSLLADEQYRRAWVDPITEGQPVNSAEASAALDRVRREFARRQQDCVLRIVPTPN